MKLIKYKGLSACLTPMCYHYHQPL